MKELSIKNYKCLDNFSISGVQQVNLFTGRNNTGKSTVLEALFLLFSGGDLDAFSKVVKLRDVFINTENLDNIAFFSLFVKNHIVSFDKSLSTHISFGKYDISFGFHYFSKSRKVGDQQEQCFNVVSYNGDYPEDSSLCFKVKFKDTYNLYNLGSNLFQEVKIITPLISEFYIDKVHFIAAKSLDMQEVSLLWDKIIYTSKEDFVIDALKLIEPKITRLSFVQDQFSIQPNLRVPVVKLEGSEKPHLLSAMGDGINRILGIILVLVNAQDGVVCMDEFENGLHYAVQAQLWQIIFKIANKLNIQIFASTYSNDTITSFAQVLEQNKDYQGSLYRMHKKKEEIKANLFTQQELKEAALQGINLR